MQTRRIAIGFLIFLACVAPVPVWAESPSDKPGTMTLKQFEDSLKYQRGKITLLDNLATLDVPSQFRYLNSEQARSVLVNAWGNPPEGADTLGMIFPSNMSPVAKKTWGVVITYEEDGFVSDEGAEKMDFAQMLQQMKDRTAEASKARAEQGYEAVELIGWATPPHYDRSEHKLYWAKEVKFGSAAEHTLNYNIRVLGRQGVLVLNAVASMEQLKIVESGMQQVLKFVNFKEGHRYTDYLPGKDKVAEYGVGALVVGAVAAKMGLFKLLLVGLIAAKKFIVIGVLGSLAFIGKLFGKKQPAAAPPSEG